MEKSFSSELPVTSAARSVWLARKEAFVHVHKLTIETTKSSKSTTQNSFIVKT